MLFQFRRKKDVLLGCCFHQHVCCIIEVFDVVVYSSIVLLSFDLLAVRCGVESRAIFS